MRNASSFRRSSTLLAMVGTSLLASACASDPVGTGPELVRRNTDVVAGASANVLSRKAARVNQESGSLTITAKKGGTLVLPASGLSVTVPAGAIASGELTITVTAAPGKQVSYDFQPHGTQFLKPLVLNQNLNVAEWSATLYPKLWGVYTAGTVDQVKGTAKADEVFAATVTTDRKTGVSTVSFSIWHFSGYTVATGREEVDPAGTLGM